MNYWLMKSEPNVYSWDDLVRDKVEHWDGIRNYQARNFMRKMAVGDRVFFYHSNIGLEVVGVAEVVKLTYPDFTFKPEAGKKNPWEMVDISPVEKLKNPVTLQEIKANSNLKDMVLVNNMRLSVQPVAPNEWEEVLRMSEVC